jgi:hypothetical protein
MIVGVQVRARVHSTRDAGGKGSMLVLPKRNMLAGPVRGIVRGMAVIRGHGVPEGAPLRGDSAELLAWADRAAKRQRYEKTLTYPEAIAAEGGEAVKRVPRSSSDSSGS